MGIKVAAVIVAGSWGTALACVLAENVPDVWIWSRNEAQVTEINSLHRNSKYHKDFLMPDNIRATTSIEEAVSTAEAVLIVAPSGEMRNVTRKVRPYLKPETLLIHATKGFETESLKRMTEVISEELPDVDKKRIVVLSGPSHAEEVVMRCPTTVVIASGDLTAAEAAQDLLITPVFRVYTNPDVIGVEVSGALKNIIALGAGLIDGLNFGDNAKAALMTRGLAEITRLGVAMGARPFTFSGLAGIGDLIVTCTSRHSRNWRAGYMLGQGKGLEHVLETMGMVVEGVKTTQSTYMLAKQYNVSMPITVSLFQVLFEGKSPKAAVEELMGRVPTHEIEEIARSVNVDNGH